jgi:hypothetical protein
MIKWSILILGILNFGFMAFDGIRALLVGDYIRPKSGKHAGKLGSWSRLVKKAGIDPESKLMKIIFVVTGLTGLLFDFLFLLDYDSSKTALLILNICSLWYLVPGTVICGIQIILLLILKN